MTRDLVLISNSKHAKSDSPEVRAAGILGDWLAGRGDGTRFTTFDPDRVALVVGTAHGRVLGVYETVEHGEDGRTWQFVDDAARPGRRRVRFYGQPSREFSHMVGQASPVTWARGERNPVKVQALEDLRSLYADVEAVRGVGGTELRAAAGGAVLRVGPDGSVTVEVPPHTDVTVRTVNRTSDTGKHYTPHDLTQKMVELALGNVREHLEQGKEFTVYDPSCGTGGMLAATVEYIARLQRERDEQQRQLTELLGSETVREVEALVARQLAKASA
ncbi:N-6 DNA methylase [Streptomyces longhuiensis]|uniref:N-6 DNA methylase n=1 Tax=Streptomyces longhuiensis TaxID=2880933 RepID=UPI001D0A7951|nr:N-6 DNA methylase [Streptomyces longhuiensis]UDM05544.1 N-6 DNA methylase [Streptomyces longhuiensis]